MLKKLGNLFKVTAVVELKCELRQCDTRAHVLNQYATLPHSSPVFQGIEKIKMYIYIYMHTHVYLHS